METLAVVLMITQAVGGGWGAFYAVWGEYAYVQALRDGRVSEAEAAHLMRIALALRKGMGILLVASLGLVVLSYVTESPIQPALVSTYWTFMTLAFVVIAASWALSRKRISFAFGSAIVFTGWWYLFYISFGMIPAYAFGASLAFFVILIGVFYALLNYVRMLLRS